MPGHVNSEEKFDSLGNDGSVIGMQEALTVAASGALTIPLYLLPRHPHVKDTCRYVRRYGYRGEHRL